MKFGTPKEDASRRDLTINSMFFNINTNEIEDFCGGMEDLKKRVARTPVDPVQTFMDDPLRILRAIRFVARYNLEVDYALINAVKRRGVREAFKEKISHERIWAELAGKKDGDKYKPGILNGPNPTLGVSLLKEMGLMELIFDPTKEEMETLGYTEPMMPWDTDQDSDHHEFSIWKHTFQVFSKLHSRNSVRSDIDPWLDLIMNLSSLLHDIGKRYTGVHSTNSVGRTSYKKHEEVSAKMVEVVLTRLKAPQEIIERVTVLIDRHLRPHKLMAEGTPRACRKFVRDFKDWNFGIDLAIADNLGKKHFTSEEEVAEVQLYENLRTRIVGLMPLKDPTKLPRPITGKDLITEGFKPGPLMGQILAAIDDVLLDNPDLTRDQAMDIARTFR
jgi:poly(A) polymerase